MKAMRKAYKACYLSENLFRPKILFSGKSIAQRLHATSRTGIVVFQIHPFAWVSYESYKMCAHNNVNTLREVKCMRIFFIILDIYIQIIFIHV